MRNAMMPAIFRIESPVVVNALEISRRGLGQRASLRLRHERIKTIDARDFGKHKRRERCQKFPDIRVGTFNVGNKFLLQQSKCFGTCIALPEHLNESAVCKLVSY